MHHLEEDEVIRRLSLENRLEIVNWQSVSRNCASRWDEMALEPLHKLCEIEDGVAVLLLHHPRKGEGDEGQSARGSGALTSFADILITFGKYDKKQADDRRRILKAVGRFTETTPEVVIELTDYGHKTIGSKAETSQADRLDVIYDLLPDEQQGLAAKELRDQWPKDGIPKPGIRTLQKDLKYGVEKERWDRLGNGVSGDPFLFAHKCKRNSARIESLGDVT